MRRLILATLLLAGCASKSPVSESDAVFRDVTVAIASSTRFDAERFVGDWVRIGAFTRPYTLPGCATFSFRMSGGDYVVSPCGADLPLSPITVEPYGRLQLASGSPLWVLWVDEDHRTAVIGTPDGSLGWILNREPEIRRDRLAAAREVLAFNGYDIARLKMRAP